MPLRTYSLDEHGEFIIPLSAAASALIVLDLQEDFCPPHGNLAVPFGRDVLSTVQELIAMPFAVKIATKDWHPPNHVSFASNHPGKYSYCSPVTITNPSNPDETCTISLWPDHCIAGTPGANLVQELDFRNLGIPLHVIEKGTDARTEMYSAFFDCFKRPHGDSGLLSFLKSKGVQDVVVVGLAFDYCVKETAKDAYAEGFRTIVVVEGTRCVNEHSWENVEAELFAFGVDVISLDSLRIRDCRRSLDVQGGSQCEEQKVGEMNRNWGRKDDAFLCK